MTTEEKLEKIKKLADAMYFAAQTLTVDASRMRKPVEDYHQFVTHDLYDREDVDALGRAMAASFALAADEKGMLADSGGRRIKLTEEGRRELEAIKKTNGGWLRDQKHDEKSQTVDFGQELYKHFGRVKDFTLCTAIAKWFYETGRKAARDEMLREADEIAAKYSAPPREPKRRRPGNDRTQFEIISSHKQVLIEEYEWCRKNLHLKDNYGLVYQVTEFYITTSSQRIIDKVNKHFGTKLDFKGQRYYYI